MSQAKIREITIKLYVDFLRSLVTHSEDPYLQDAIQDISLAALLADSNGNINPLPVLKRTVDDVSLPRKYDPFCESELLTYGTPVRRHLGTSTRRQLLADVKATLFSIAEYLEDDDIPLHSQGSTKDHSPAIVERIESRKREIETLAMEIETVASGITHLIIQISETREDLDDNLKHLLTTSFPLHDAARSSSLELLTATIEASLVKLSFTKAQTEQRLYTHSANQKSVSEGKTLNEAIYNAHHSLKEEEKKMESELSSLDRELKEYETLLRLVDGNNGGYQQIINDWTKVQQETDECLKDLRRLGWAGD